MKAYSGFFNSSNNTSSYAHWNNVKTTVNVPQAVNSNAAFVIKITTTNKTGNTITWGTSGSVKGKGVPVAKILHESSGVEILNPYMIRTMDYRMDSIAPHESIVFEWEYRAVIVDTCADEYKIVNAPKGAYNIYLENGEIIHSAFVVK